LVSSSQIEIIDALAAGASNRLLFEKINGYPGCKNKRLGINFAGL
jgi:hypothetical protein